MSYTLMGKVWELDLAPSEQQLLLALAYHANDEGASCYPGVALLAWRTGLSRRHVQTILRRFRGWGLIEAVRHSGGGRGHATEYIVHIENGLRKPEFERVAKEASPELRAELVELYERTCAYCGGQGNDQSGPDGETWHVDRIVPAARGGRYTEDNVCLSCATCNRRKKDAVGAPFIPAKPPKRNEPGGGLKGANGALKGAHSAPHPSLTSQSIKHTPSSAGAREAEAFSPEGPTRAYPKAASLNGKKAEQPAPEGLPFPGTFPLSKEMRGWALAYGLDLEWLRLEHERFCAHYRGALHPPKTDWEAVWQKWMLGEILKGNGKQPVAGPGPPQRAAGKGNGRHYGREPAAPPPLDPSKYAAGGKYGFLFSKKQERRQDN